MSEDNVIKIPNVGEISCYERVKLYAERIKSCDGKYNSIVTLCEEEAYRQAEYAEELIKSNRQTPVTGMVYTAKDNILTKGIRTTCGSKMLYDFVPSYDATVIERLKKAGAILIGKTNMDEFSMGSDSQYSVHGGVKNNFGENLSPGGSSGGAAVSVSADFCDFALGSDTGGSVRLPATFCGVSGIKPTYGTISRHGLISYASSLDQIGIIAKAPYIFYSVLNVISGKDFNDFTLANKEKRSFFEGDFDLKGKKIGVISEYYKGSETDPQITTVMKKMLKFYESMGAEIKMIRLGVLENSPLIYKIIASAEATSNLERYDGVRFGYRAEGAKSYEELIKKSRGEGFGAVVKSRILFGNYVLSEENYTPIYERAVNLRMRLCHELNKAFTKYDLILAPTALETAYPISEMGREDHEYKTDITNTFANLCGIPAITTPCGYTSEGLPIGVTLFARGGGENELIYCADNWNKEFTKRGESNI